MAECRPMVETTSESEFDAATGYKHAYFDAAASGNLVAAVAGKVIKVHAITIQDYFSNNSSD